MGNTCCPQPRSNNKNKTSYDAINEAEMNMTQKDRALKHRNMFIRPMGKGTARDSVRLLSKVEVEGFNNEGINTDENILYKVARQVASLFNNEEQEKVISVITDLKEKHGVLDTKQPTALLDLIVHFFDNLGKDESSTCRVFKMFHQKFVLEAVCALKFQGGLLNITTRDFTWNIYISKRKKTQINQTKIIVKHIRTEYIIIDNGGKNPVGSFKGNNENIPKITYELEFIFDKTFSSMLKVKLSIIEVDDKGMNNIDLPKDIIKIKTDLSLNQQPIIIFESTTNIGE